MKLMIISDIHGSYNDLEKVMHYFDEEQPDRLIILGDILYHGPRNDLPEGYAPKKCIPLLNKYKDKENIIKLEKNNMFECKYSIKFYD